MPVILRLRFALYSFYFLNFIDDTKLHDGKALTVRIAQCEQGEVMFTGSDFGKQEFELSNGFWVSISDGSCH